MTVDGDRAFFDDERLHVLGDGNGDDPGNANRWQCGRRGRCLDMAADDMTAQAAADLHGPVRG